MPTKSSADLNAVTLNNPKAAAEYLSAVYEECMTDGQFDAFLIAVRDLIQAQSSMGRVARAAGVGRQALYHMLSERGNPQLGSLASVLKAIGLKVKFEPERKRGKKAA